LVTAHVTPDPPNQIAREIDSITTPAPMPE